jgi:type IV/VI secretion system ImpK/VasF family protein
MRELTNEAEIPSTKILEDFFMEFYYEILKCKEIALKTTQLDAEIGGKDNSAADSGSEAANVNKHPLLAHEIKNVPVHAVRAATEIQTRLKNLLKEQINKVINLLNHEDLIQLKDSQYAMVALADEIFLTFHWSGAQLWQKFLLESQMFQTQSAGTQLFQKIDELLAKYEPKKKNLAYVYFHVLALGFAGKFSEEENLPMVKAYEARLYAFTYGQNPPGGNYTKLMPECYDSTISLENSPKLPDVKFWTRVVVAMMLLFLFISYIIWHSVASGLYESLNNIFNQFEAFLDKK